MPKPKNEPTSPLIDAENLQETVEILGARETWKAIEQQFDTKRARTYSDARNEGYNEGLRRGQDMSAGWAWAAGAGALLLVSLIIGVICHFIGLSNLHNANRRRAEEAACANGNTAACMSAVQTHLNEVPQYTDAEQAALLRSIYEHSTGKPLPGTR